MAAATTDEATTGEATTDQATTDQATTDQAPPAAPEEALPNTKVPEPADVEEPPLDGPHRTAPLFGHRPAVLKNPAKLPSPDEVNTDADLIKPAEDLAWLDKPVPSEEEQRLRHERRELRKKEMRRKRRRKKAAIITGSILTVILVIGFAWYQYTFSGLERMPTVAGQTGADTPGENFLLVATNPEQPDPDRPIRTGWRNDFANSDMVMWLHLSRDKRTMTAISIPSDSAIQIPGHGIGKLSDAYAFDGAELYVRTVEELAGIKLDRVITLNLNAFREMADILDGVIVNAPTAVCDDDAGPRRVDGQTALEFISLRDCMPNKDLDRVARQQSLMKALMRGSVDGGTVTHPLRLNKMLRAAAQNTTLEDGLSMPSMLSTLWSLRHLRTTNTTFITLPVAADAIATTNGIDFVRLDPAKDADLWDAVRIDEVQDYLKLSGVPVA